MYLFQKEEQGLQEAALVYSDSLRSTYSPGPNATAKSAVGQEHETGLNTVAKGPVMSGASENHPDRRSGTLRPLATLEGDREKVQWAEPLVTLLQAQGHNPWQTQELRETAWVPHSGCPALGAHPGCPTANSRDLLPAQLQQARATRGGLSLLLHATQHSLL